MTTLLLQPEGFISTQLRGIRVRESVLPAWLLRLQTNLLEEQSPVYISPLEENCKSQLTAGSNPRKLLRKMQHLLHGASL